MSDLEDVYPWFDYGPEPEEIAELSKADKTLDSVLDSIFAYGVDWTEHRENQETGDHDVAVYAAKIKTEFKEQAKSDIKALIHTIIGEDEESKPIASNIDGTTGSNPVTDIRNELRQQQRKALENL